MSLSSVRLGTGARLRAGAVVLLATPILVATACKNDTTLPTANKYTVQLVLRAPSFTIAQNDTVSIDTAAVVVANNDTVPNPTLALTSVDTAFVAVDGTDVIGISPTPAGQLARVAVTFQDVNNNATVTDTASFLVTPPVAPPAPPRVTSPSALRKGTGR
ncbi:MAG TPA: hypothetical protein VF166_14405 [Gemmatimonadaceae bacterium]